MILGADESGRRQTPGTPGAARRSPRKGDEGQVGAVLREAYRATVDESVPDEMLDLLNKLQ